MGSDRSTGFGPSNHWWQTLVVVGIVVVVGVGVVHGGIPPLTLSLALSLTVAVGEGGEGGEGVLGSGEAVEVHEVAVVVAMVMVAGTETGG